MASAVDIRPIFPLMQPGNVDSGQLALGHHILQQKSVIPADSTIFQGILLNMALFRELFI